jgi:hypothetical protein
MPFPFNRLVAFAGPYISVVAAGLATVVVAKLNALGVPGLDESDVAEQIAGALTFTLVSCLTWLGSSQWLKGHHAEMTADAEVQAAALAATAPPPGIEPSPDAVNDALIALGEDLPSDEEEFGLPSAPDPLRMPGVGA